MRPYSFLAATALAAFFLTAPLPAAQAQETPSMAPVSEAALPTKDEVLALKETDIPEGEADAPVTIVEYASLSCSHCAHFFNSVVPELREKYIDTGKLRLIHRDFPLNESALRGSMLAHCSGEDNFHTFLKVLYKSQGKWAYDNDFRNKLATLATLGGMSRETFEECMTDKALEERILHDMKVAGEVLKVESTPTIFINGEKYEGAREIEAISKRLDDEIAKAD